MAYRWDIPEKLIYSCNCGWIDYGHANGRAARELWKDIIDEKFKYRQNGFDGYKISFTESTLLFGFALNKNSKDYFIKSNLSNVEKERVALSIFQEVSLGFEAQQLSPELIPNSGQIPIGPIIRKIGPASGFSEEDLVSNLLGFYKALRGTDLKDLCNIRTKEESLKIWDRDGAVGYNKNYTFSPKFHQCDGCSNTPQFPIQYQSIQPIEKGVLHFDFNAGSATPILSDDDRRFQNWLFQKHNFNFGFGFLDVPTEVTLTIQKNENEYFFLSESINSSCFSSRTKFDGTNGLC